MSSKPQLSYVESCLPAETAAQRLRLALDHHLALELPDHGDLDLEPYQRAGVPISSIQAYRLHDEHPLSPEAAKRQEAAKHVRSAIELADRSGSRRVVTICSYGHELADRPFDRCLDFYAAVESHARRYGVRLMIEPLSPLRTSAMIDPHEIARLVAVLDAPDAFAILLDTGHLADSGIDLDPFFDDWDHPVEELQLRGPGSTPPAPDLPFASWVAALPAPPAVASVEHRTPITPGELEELISSLRLAGME